MDPSKDGVEHINVYSRGQTMAGRWMSNFARAPFVHPSFGRFESVEGLWYWLSCRDDRLRALHGFVAKKLGRELRARDWPKDEQFRASVAKGIQAKLEQNPREAALVRATALPLIHYYVFGAGQVHDMTRDAQWMLDIFDAWRK